MGLEVAVEIGSGVAVGCRVAIDVGVGEGVPRIGVEVGNGVGVGVSGRVEVGVIEAGVTVAPVDRSIFPPHPININSAPIIRALTKTVIRITNLSLISHIAISA